MTVDTKLSGVDLVDRLFNTPARRIARLPFKQQVDLLWRIVVGEAQVTEAEGAALLESLRLQPQEVGRAISHVEAIRRENLEGRAAFERLQEIDAKLSPLIAELEAKATELFGDWQAMVPTPFTLEWSHDRCETSAPALRESAAKVTEAMTGRFEVARKARPFEEPEEMNELVALIERRRETAADAARRVAS